MIKLNVGVSVTAHRDVAELENCGCGYDIWIAPQYFYDRGYALYRGGAYGYFLLFISTCIQFFT